MVNILKEKGIVSASKYSGSGFLMGVACRLSRYKEGSSW